MEIKIRSFVSEDLKAIREIFNDVILKTTAIYSETLMSHEEIQEWGAMKTKGNWPVFIAELDGQVIGFTSYGTFRSREGYNSTVELAIHMREEFRGKGIGSKLLSWLIQDAKNRGFHVMMAGIDSSNIGSIRLHERFGFNVCGEVKQVARKFDKWLDLTFMQKIL